MKTKKSFNDKMFEIIDTKLGPVFSKIGENKIVKTIAGGMMLTIGVLTIGSIFIMLFGLATNFGFASFLAPISGPLLVGYQLTMGLTGLFVAVAMSGSYAKQYNMELLSSTVTGLAAFILLTSTVTDGAISIGNLGAQGIVAAIISSLVTMSILRFFKEKNITIKMPDGVPPEIAATFSSLIPSFLALLLMWLVKSVFNFDLVSAVQALLRPIFSAVDSLGAFTLRFLFGQAVWSVGLHADAILTGITGPLTSTWIVENADAAATGLSATQLPFIWTQPTERMVGWTASIWGLMFWLFRSKSKKLRTIAVAGLPSAVFTIIEPILFGLPVVFNPYLVVPFILSATVAAFFTYGVMALGLVSRFYVALPWITPPPILGFLGTGGDWKMVVVVIINTIIGILIYAPFFKAYEKSELAKEADVKAK
jgi:PTS system cellobiose-specific IIC component